MARYSVHVPVDDMQISEDVHMILNHAQGIYAAYMDTYPNIGIYGTDIKAFELQKSNVWNCFPDAADTKTILRRHILGDDQAFLRNLISVMTNLILAPKISNYGTERWNLSISARSPKF